MRDPQIAPKFRGKTQEGRRKVKLEYWHYDWSKRLRNRVEFRPESRVVEDSDYNQHYVDVEAPLAAEVEFGDRSDEIRGHSPGDPEKLPTGSERVRGALLGAVVGDAFAFSCDKGHLKTYSWYMGNNDVELVDYLPSKHPLPTWITQLMAHAAESLIRALVARRTGATFDPVSAVQHGFQRWFHDARRNMLGPDKVKDWRKNGGIYAAGASDRDLPGGIVTNDPYLAYVFEPAPAVVDALQNFAQTGIRSTPADPRSTARGGDVLVRAALAAVWSEDVSETFDLAVDIAALTHSHPDDFLAAGALAVILHQQIRDQPFMDCVMTAYHEVVRRPDHEKTRLMISRSAHAVRGEQVPTGVDNLRRYFPGLGVDGAETLGVALYCAMASDYVREALLLALNYASNRTPVAAVAGMLIGAEYGVDAIPDAFLRPNKSIPTLDTLAHDLAIELRDVLTDAEWLRRYPPT